MASKSKIEWTDATWSPVVGCSKISDGCTFCWAEGFARRLKAMGHKKYQDVVDEKGWTGNVTLDESALEIPLHWRKPRRIFVVSMGDLFHPKVPFEFINSVFGIIALCPQHTFLLLTKRIKRAAEISAALPENAHLGVSVSNQAEADEKIPILLQIPAAKRWVSVEPFLSKIDLSRWAQDWKCPVCRGTGVIGFGSGSKRCPMFCHLSWKNGNEYFTADLDWVVVGCESGPKRRPCKLEWVRDIVNQCKAAGVPVFVKQIPVNGKVSHDMSEWPEDLRVRQMP